MKKNAKYFFHPKLELYRCSEGVLSCHIMGNKISLFESGIDSDFSSFILHYINKPFSVLDMEKFFFDRNKKYNFGNIMRALNKNHLINEADKQKSFSVTLVNFTEISNEDFSAVFREFNQECKLALINGFRAKNQQRGFYEELDDIKKDQVIFAISDLKGKFNLSEVNRRFFKKGRYWCPVVMDRYGGYIGPLLHSVPSGPCFSCYEGAVYSSADVTESGDGLPSLWKMFLRTVFLEALKVSTNLSPSQVIYSNLLEIDCFNHRSRAHYIYTNSNCSMCGV